MMISHRDRKRFWKSAPWGMIALLVVVLVVALFSGFAMPAFIKNSVRFVFTPVFRLEGAVGSFGGGIITAFRSKQALEHDNEKLRQSLREAELNLLERNQLKEENTQLKEKFGRSEGRGGVLAAVLSWPDRSPYDTFIIDTGENLGVRKDSLVYVSDDIALGRVREVYASTALVSLFSTPGEQTPVLIGTPGVAVVALGRGSGNFSVKLPRGVDVEENDPVVIPGIDPKLFGVVERIVENPADTFKTILFKNPINLSEIQYVYIAQ